MTPPLMTRLDTYRQRLKETHPDDIDRRQYYQEEISLMEAEQAKSKLIIDSLGRQKPTEYWSDSLQTISDIFRAYKVLELDYRWSWKHFRWLFYLKVER